MALRFDHLNVGDSLAPLVKGPLEKSQFVAYGQAAMDANPIHTDDEFAQQSGYKSVFAQGMLSMGFLAQMLVDNAGAGNVSRFKVRFISRMISRTAQWDWCSTSVRSQASTASGSPAVRTTIVPISGSFNRSRRSAGDGPISVW